MVKDIRFAVNFSKNVRIALNATNAVKKNLSGEIIFLPLKRWNKNFFNATSRIQWKKFSAINTMRRKRKFLPLPAECCEKKFSPMNFQTLQMFTANFNACLNFTGSVTEVGDSWRTGIPCTSVFLYAVKKFFHR